MEPGATPPPAASPEIRETPPAGESRRAVAPGKDDQERAFELCAEVSRALLGDFAPALLLLSEAERRRAQAFFAYACALFDSARRPAVESERLARITYWELALAEALAGEADGQPIFLRMAREQKRRPWPEAGLTELGVCARRRAARPRPETPEQAEADAENLARAAATVLLGAPPPGEVSTFAGALVRLRTLQVLGAEVRARRCPLPVSELPLPEGEEAEPQPERLIAAAQRECQRLRPRLLRAPRGMVSLPPGYRRAAMFSLLAALRLVTRFEDGGPELLQAPPKLGVVSRLGLLARARWFPV
jgi:hypothetical protein